MTDAQLKEWIARLNWIGSQPLPVRSALREECRARGGHVKSGEAFMTNPPIHVCAHCASEFKEEETRTQTGR